MKDHILESIKNLEKILVDTELLTNIEISISKIVKALSNNLPLLVFGNGGSASDALHISGELVGKFYKERKPYNVICLNSNVVVLTAWSNDYNFVDSFARQVEAHGVSGGVALGISTSGNSKSVIYGIKRAEEMGMTTICLTGKDGGELKNIANILVSVPSISTPRIQEMHSILYHYMCEKIELELSKL